MVTPEVPSDLSAVIAHVESTYPNEGCGIILRGLDGKWRVQPMQNVYDKYHAVDPEGFPRTSRTAYFFDPREWLKASEEAERRGERVACLFHSHCDVGTYFSAEDKAMAAPDGEPLHPGVFYLVVAVDKGRASAAKVFWWQAQQFQELNVALGAVPP
jgi:[CysO sulfur-carrier protein]-S-L-cysteine hydrolase